MSRQARLIVVLVAMSILAVMVLVWIAGRYSRLLQDSTNRGPRPLVAGALESVKTSFGATHP